MNRSPQPAWFTSAGHTNQRSDSKCSETAGCSQGVRSVAVGDGEELELLYVPESADVREGDLLISSGLGEVFPAGYPVGTVTAVVHDANAAFARVRARPMAAIGRSREFLLVFRAGTAPDSVALAR